MTETLIIATLIVLNGLFVAAEFALIGAPRPSLERLAAEGRAGAARVLAVARDDNARDRYIATAQLGITVASLGLGMYGEHVLALALTEPLTALGIGAGVHGVASALSVASLTFLHIVLGEMVPKTLALAHPIPTALWVSSPLRLVKLAFYPVVVSLNALGNGIVRLAGIDHHAGSKAPTPDDLRFIVEESVAEGKLDADAGEVIGDLFDFSERTATEVMTPRVRIVGIPRGASALILRKVLRGQRHTRYPVYEETLDHVVGFVLIRDLLEPLLTDTPLSDELIRPVPFVPETSRLDRVLAKMRREKTQIAVVMDEFGGTAGILTSEDLYEEVVGEIADGSASRLPLEWIGGKLRALGYARLDEVGEELDLALEHDEVDSVSGLVLFLLDRAPEVGDHVAWEGLEFHVIAIEGHGVRECEVRVLAGG